MARVSNRLAAAKLDSLHSGKHADGDGLWLYKSDSGTAKWVLRRFVYGSREEMGLGAYRGKAGVGLKVARQEASKWRAVAATGFNLIAERDRIRREAEKNLHTLKDVTADTFEARKAELKGGGKVGRWLSDTYHRPTGRNCAAMVGDVSTGGAHRTFLDRSGARLDRSPKMMVGPCGGGAVRLSEAVASLMVCDEGIETGDRPQLSGPV